MIHIRIVSYHTLILFSLLFTSPLKTLLYLRWKLWMYSMGCVLVVITFTVRVGVSSTFSIVERKYWFLCYFFILCSNYCIALRGYNYPFWLFHKDEHTFNHSCRHLIPLHCVLNLGTVIISFNRRILYLINYRTACWNERRIKSCLYIKIVLQNVY